MITMPGFHAESALGDFKRHAGRAARTGDVSEIIQPAQSLIDALQTWRESPLHNVVAPGCPWGERATLAKIRECQWWLPIFECSFTGGGNYVCYIRRYECGHYNERYEWQCQPPVLQAA
jgi:hypothetical protein